MTVELTPAECWLTAAEVRAYLGKSLATYQRHKKALRAERGRVRLDRLALFTARHYPHLKLLRSEADLLEWRAARAKPKLITA